MINNLLVVAFAKSVEEYLKAEGIPYEIEDSDAYKNYMGIWNRSKRQAYFMKQARPAVARIAQLEPYFNETDGEPLRIRFNGTERDLDQDSFAEVLLERSDLDWAIGFSIKNDAKVLTDMRIADRSMGSYMDKESSSANEIEDFGSKIFGVPCSNEYFDDVNAILQHIHAYDTESWRKQLADDDFVYDNVVTPILAVLAREIPRLCKDHPEAPMHFFDYFYGKYDYYYLNPIDKLRITRMGAINVRGGLGRIPGTDNHFVNVVKKPTELLDVRFATGKYGEISRDTLQMTFDGGWAMCFNIHVSNTLKYGRSFNLGVYMPVTPFGSFREEARWEK